MKLLESVEFKKFLQYLALILFPITINYLSPYLIIAGATQGIITGSFIAFILLLLGAIFFGRLFCSTLCPAGAAGDFTAQARTRPVKNGWRNHIKWTIWLPWLAGITAGFITAGGIKEINPLFMTDSGISVDRAAGYIIYLGVLFLITTINLIWGKRAACHYICWMSPFMIIGMKIRQALRLPGLTLKANDSCISCGKCTKVCPMSLDVKDMVATNHMTHTECILCGQCKDTCPKDTISYAFKKS